MGFDFGLRRIGVAVGSQLSGHAQALASVASRNAQPDWLHLANLVDEWQPVRFIVGLPGTLQGEETQMTREARGFVKALQERFAVPVDLVDEQLSSVAARDELRAARQSGQRKRRVKKGDLDPVAAKLILETWLNERAIAKVKDKQT